MKQVKVRYSVTFEATIDVPDDVTPRQIGDELSNINIPEDGYSRYVSDTFAPVTDDNGDPEIFGSEIFLAD